METTLHETICVSDDETILPDYTKDKIKVPTSSLVAVGGGTILSLLCIVLSIPSLVKSPIGQLRYLSYISNPRLFEAFSLLVNLALTFVTDSLSYVHSMSLRWALAKEGRLEFNTNIRLLTSSLSIGPNRWWANAISLLTLMLYYGATSVLFISSTTNPYTMDGEY